MEVQCNRFANKMVRHEQAAALSRNQLICAANQTKKSYTFPTEMESSKLQGIRKKFREIEGRVIHCFFSRKQTCAGVWLKLSGQQPTEKT